MAITPEILEQFRSVVSREGLITAPEELRTYECDGLTNFRVMPLAVLFSLSRWIELSLFPYAIILQVTPIVAIALDRHCGPAVRRIACRRLLPADDGASRTSVRPAGAGRGRAVDGREEGLLAPRLRADEFRERDSVALTVNESRMPDP